MHGQTPRYPYKIDLNLLPVLRMPDFRIYRKLHEPVQEQRAPADAMSYRLPDSPDDDDRWSQYWVSIEEKDGFEEYWASATTNHQLTVRVLYWSLKQATQTLLSSEEYLIDHRGFYNEISYIQHSYEEGHELLVVQPYYLRSARRFGFLTDFRFKLGEGVTFSRRVQQLSLSLDRRFRRNFDYYSDRIGKIRGFTDARRPVLDALRIPAIDHTIKVANEFVALPATRLKSKTYVFANDRESRSQFMGLQSHGPLSGVSGNLRLLFVFREQDRTAARRLAMNIRGAGSSTRGSFPGFNRLFGCEPEIDRDPQVLRDLSHASISQALERSKRAMSRGDIVVPIIVLPNEDDGAYLVQKSLFAHSEIATQVCTLRILQDESALRWAISNIALQVFCKAGGLPWKVRPSGEASLILGISQSHKVRREENGRVSVERYFAFSVMTDNSGLFQKIQVLSDSDDQRDYFKGLRDSLRDVVRSGARQFSNVIIHTSFKLKRSEVDAIREVVKEVSRHDDSPCRFAVVKINHRTKFFGANRSVNSLVPYEATKVRIGRGEYLLWFEGIFPDKATVAKAFPGPTHIQIIHPDDENRIPDDVLLQDLVNLSGANWRGFNAKSTPVSVFYCHLVADFVHDFRDKGLPLPAVSDIRPWFL